MTPRISTRKNRRTRSLVLGGAFGTVLLLSAGCGGAAKPASSDVKAGGTSAVAAGDKAWAGIVDQANKEGKVTYYLAVAGGEDAIKKGFAKAYPDIKLTIVREGSGAIVSKLEAEFASKAAGGDVALVGDKGFFEANSAKFVPLSGPAAALYAGTEYTYDANAYFATTVMPLGMVVNTEVVKQIGARPIKTYEDLLQPQLKGLIGISDPRIAAVILQRVTHESEVLGVDYMPKLAALTPRIYEALGAQVQAVASGDLAVGMTVYSAALVEAIKAGAPIEGVYPIPEAYIYFQGIPKTAAHPAAAQVLQDWLLSKAGQQAQHEWGYTGSVLPDIKGAYAVKPGTVMFRGNLTAKDKDFQKTWNQLFAK